MNETVLQLNLPKVQDGVVSCMRLKKSFKIVYCFVFFLPPTVYSDHLSG